MATTHSNASIAPAHIILKLQSEERHISPELVELAFQNKHPAAFHYWINLNEQDKLNALSDRYVFYSVCNHSFAHLQNLLKIDIEQSNFFVEKLLALISSLTRRRAGFTEEWFRGLHELSCSLTDLNYLKQASSIIQWAKETGVDKFPRIAQQTVIQSAYLDSLIGNIDTAATTALNFIKRPYLHPDKKELPGLYLKLMYILSSSNHIPEYRDTIWRGVSSVHASGDQRDAFAVQIVKTYRGALRALLCNEVSLFYRIPFLLGNVSRIVSSITPLRWLQLHLVTRGLHLGELYLLDFFFGKKIASLHLGRSASPSTRQFLPLKSFRRKTKKKILVTRAMGGLGDILMMTPGLKALASKHPDAEIHFATQKSFLPILESLKNVKRLDILNDDIDMSQYKKWVNLSNCPAGRVEGLQYPNVRKNRTEIFAKAMGVSKWMLKRGVGLLPQYDVTAEESVLAQKFLSDSNPDGLPVIGVQPFAADSYRNWPHMEDFVVEASKKNIVLVFHHEDIDGYNGKNIIKIKRPIRECVALAKECNRLVVLDSSFLHFAAALGTPTVVLFGAISGKLRTRDYPNVHLIAPDKKDFPCYPCWRHEHKPCHLTNGRESICFRSFKVNQVINALSIPDAEWPGQDKPQNPLVTFKNWILYGAA